MRNIQTQRQLIAHPRCERIRIYVEERKTQISMIFIEFSVKRISNENCSNQLQLCTEYGDMQSLINISS